MCFISQGALCHRLEEHVLSLETHVDSADTSLAQQRESDDLHCFHCPLLPPHSTADYIHKVERCIKNLLEALDEVVDTFKKALYFLLVRVSQNLSS